MPSSSALKEADLSEIVLLLLYTKKLYDSRIQYSMKEKKLWSIDKNGQKVLLCMVPKYHQ